MNNKALFAAFFLIGGVHPLVMSQSAPSWRSAAERPERVDAPPEVGAPEMSFEIDRDSLFGKPMGFAPANEPVDSTPDMVSVQPELGTTQSASASLLVPQSADPGKVESQSSDSSEALAVEATSMQPGPETDAPGDNPVDSLADIEVENSNDDPATVSQGSLAGNPDAETAANDAQQELDAVQEAATVVPEQSVASISTPAPVSSLAKPQKPAESSLKLVRTQTIAPDYPKKAARLGEEGWVDLQLTIDPDGKVSRVSVVESQPRMLFDSAARRAARQWRYQPPSLAGVDEPITTQIRLNFVLD